jgi:cysteine desulfurase
MRPIYLDHNATTPQDAAVTRAMLPFFEPGQGNPSSVHGPGRAARGSLEEARAQVAALLGTVNREVVFTSGATEANNLALQGVIAARGGSGHLVVSPVEHPSVGAVAAWLEEQGVRVTRLAVDGDGRVDPEEVRRSLRPDTHLVSVMLANNETGVLQPVAEIGAVTREAGIPLHVDAAQAVGRLTLQVNELNADLLSLSGHKMFGPRGVGALWARSSLVLEPLLRGGGQEFGRRSGTENLPGAVGLAEAARLGRSTPATYRDEVLPLRDRLEAGLLEAWPGAVVHGAGAPRLANTTLVGFPGLDGEAAVMRLDLEGVAVSLGSACAAGTMRPSLVLEAMGVPLSLARSSLRFSLGPGNTVEEIDHTLEAFRRLAVAGTLASTGARAGDAA